MENEMAKKDKAMEDFITKINTSQGSSNNGMNNVGMNQSNNIQPSMFYNPNSLNNGNKILAQGVVTNNNGSNVNNPL